MEVSSSAGFNHLNNFIHPQATIIDGSGEEELYFMKGVKERASTVERTIIELPADAEQNLMWITLLDGASLSGKYNSFTGSHILISLAWNKASIDILVHAPLSSSGSLIRLLNSLKKADFFSSAVPRLTIELPHNIDEPTRQYLERFRWPPNAVQNGGSLLALHHRIPQHGLSTEENSIRFLESFWPADPFNSHVLVLSPQVEVSPLFYHYLKYTMLEYRHSGSKGSLHKNLLGISLDLPSAYLNDSTNLIPPRSTGPLSTNDAAKEATPFLWQAPNSNAALYFGDKWVELHDFVAHLLSSQHTLPTPTTLNQKFVSKAYPSWLEHILKLARARGYWSIYPNSDDSDTLVTLHNDLYRPPEEYTEETEATDVDSDVLTADITRHLSTKHAETALLTKSLLSTLPFNGDLPKLEDMPLLSWDGERSNFDEIRKYALNYSLVFRHEIGGCDVSTAQKPIVDLAARDLFCLKDGKLEEMVPPASGR